MFDNRITRMLGIEIPIVQAPMGYIARAQLASAVSNAGAMGIIETSSGDLTAIRGEIAKMADLTDRPFGVNIAQAFVRDPSIVEFVVDQVIERELEGSGLDLFAQHHRQKPGIAVDHLVSRHVLRPLQ
jgi:enoyl-[acyl-carrier protein] reductase II